MKVKELIEKLSKYDWEAEVTIDFHEKKSINYVCEGNEKEDGLWTVAIGISLD